MSKRAAPPKIPLSNADAELALLGSMLIDPECIPDIRRLQVRASDFRIDVHGWIFDAIVAASDSGAVDFLTVCNAVEAAGHEVPTERIVAATNAVPNALHAKKYADLVTGLSTRRMLEAAAGEVARAAYDLTAPVEDAMGRAEAAVLGVRRHGENALDTAALFGGLRHEVGEWFMSPLGPGEVRGMATGIRPLDEAMCGLEVGLHIVAGRTSIGKSALCLQISGNVARRREGWVHIFSPEMSGEQMGLRLACSWAGVSSTKLKRGDVTPDEVGRVDQWLADMATWHWQFYEIATETPSSIRGHVQSAQRRHDIAMVFVDGLGLLAPPADSESNRNLALGAITRDLKLMAGMLDVRVIVTHQLSRACEQRQDKRPLLADLRESGHIEEDADTVTMLYREGYYITDERLKRMNERANIAELLIRKHRNGNAGVRVELFWNEDCARFDELSKQEEPEGW